MKTSSTLLQLAVLACTVLTGLTARADNMASIAITPATGTVTVSKNWGIGGSLAGFHLMAQDLSLGGGANQFYSVKSTAIPNGGDVTAFTRYIAASGAATAHADIGSKLTPNSYSALTSADPDVGFGPVQLYFIHHKSDGDYFSHIVPSSGNASAVADLKPMSQPGGPATGGLSGYYGLTFAAVNLNYGANLFYYLRTNASDSHAKFGTLVPALAGASADQFDLGAGKGYHALAFTGTDVGYGINQMYYLRLDSVTGFTILGTLHPGTGAVADVANLGSVFSTLTFVPGDVGFGTGQFYTTGSFNANWQSISFAAISNKVISSGSFTVKPTASSTLPVTLSVVPGSIGAASISAPVAGVFTVTPIAPGLITLQATQVGSSAPAYEYNMLRQSFTISGVATLQITSQPTSQSAVTGGTASFSVSSSGTSALSYQWRKDGVNITGNTSATSATLSLPNAQASDGGSYDVVVTNASGSIISEPVTLAVSAAPGAPVITSPTMTPATAGVPFVPYTVVATGSPTSYTATGLPPGLSLDTATGAITGTPMTGGTYSVVVAATNSSGTSTVTLTITVASPVSSRIVNFSARAVSGPGSQTLIMGFVVQGNGKNLLIRGIGPSLGSLGVVNTLADPMLTLYGSTIPVAVNDDWQTPVVQPSGSMPASNGSQIAAAASLVGAFALPNGSKDAAVIYAFDDGAHTTSMVRPNSTTGVALTEIYDIDTASGARLINVSARMNVTGGEGTLIAGLVIAGTQPKTVLIRGSGPSLAAYSVDGVLADPAIALYSGATLIAANDNWASGATTADALNTTSARVGAFPLVSGSKDAALLVTLQPGAYTVQVSGAGGATGVALVEVYDTE